MLQVMKYKIRIISFAISLFVFVSTQAQNTSDTTSTKQTIKIVHADVLAQEMGTCMLEGISQPCEFQVLKGNVILSIDQTMIYADSLRINKVEKKFEAFRKVHIIDNQTTHLYGERLLYIGKEKKMWMYNKVKVINKNDTLFTDELLYDKQKGITYYFKKGEIHSAGAVIKSVDAIYFVKEKKTILKHNVVITDSAFTIYADSVEYVNQEERSKTIKFISLTKIILDKGQLIFTKNGFYDVLNNKITLYDYSKIIDKESIYTAQTFFYNTKTKTGFAYTNFMLLDTLNHFALKADTVYFNQNNQSVHANTNCAGRMLNQEGETIYFKADTIVSAQLLFTQLDSLKKVKPVIVVEKKLSEILQDTIQQNKSKLSKNKNAKKKDLIENTIAKNPIKLKDSLQKKDTLKRIDTANRIEIGNDLATTTGERKQRKIDSSVLYRYIKAYHHVKFFKDSAQASCDSFWYDDIDSVFEFMQTPIFWFNAMQLTGIKIGAYVNQKKIDSIVAEKEVLTVEHLRDDFYNQTQADEMTFQLDSNKIKKIDGKGNVITHYFLEDKDKKITGMNRMEAKKMRINFEKQKAKLIRYFIDVKGKMYPIKKLLKKEAYLEKFAWHDSLRPKSKQEFISDTSKIRLPVSADFKILAPFQFYP